MTYLPLSIISCTKLSMIVAAWCVLLGLPFALFFGWILARLEFPGKALLSMFCLTPVVLPPVVTGFFILRFFSPHSLVGQQLALLGIQVPFTLIGAVVASFVVGLPFFIIGSRAAFEAVSSDLELVSKSLGYNPLQTFFRVVFPLALPGIGAGAVMAFARSLGEFGATAVVAGNMEGETRTLSLAVNTLLDIPGSEQKIMTLVAISLALAFICLFVYEVLLRLQRRRLEGA